MKRRLAGGRVVWATAALVALAFVAIVALSGSGVSGVDAAEADPPLPAVAGSAGGSASANGKGKQKKSKTSAKAKVPKAFDDFGLGAAAKYKLPKDAIKLRGNARTHQLRTGKLIVRSRLPMSAGKANRSAGLCKGEACSAVHTLSAAQKGKRKGQHHKGKGQHKGKGKGEHDALKGLTAEKQFPKSALPPRPFTAEEIKEAKAHAARQESPLALLQIAEEEGGADEDAEAAAEADQEAAEAEDSEEYGPAEVSLSETDSDAEVDADANADAEVDADAEMEVENGRRSRHKKHKKQHKKAHKKRHTRPRVPVLVSRPSALVRRRVKAKHLKTLRGYARHVEADSAHVHVLTPHHRTVTRRVAYVKEHKGKDGKVHRKTHHKLVTRKTKHKRKIELTALLEVTGNVLFGKQFEAKLHDHNHKQHKHSGKGKRSGATSGNPSAHAATGTAFIEDLMVLSKRAPTSAPAPAIRKGAAAKPAAAAPAAHEYHHQWRLMYADVEDGWASASSGLSSADAFAAAAQPDCPLATQWSSAIASGVPVVIPPLSFAGSHTPAPAHSRTRPSAAVHQMFADLPEHSLLAVSGTFHFLGAWNGEVGFATVNGEHVWIDTFAADTTDTDGAAATPEQHSVPFRVVVPNTAERVTIGFGSTLRGDTNPNACWAFDDVSISVLH